MEQAWTLDELIEVLQDIRRNFGQMPLFVASETTKEEVLLTNITVVKDKQGNMECMLEIE